MNLPEFEKIIRSGLSNQTVDIDTDLFMQKLFEPKKEKRRIIFFWWGLGMATLALGSLLIYMPLANENKIVNQSDSPEKIASTSLSSLDHRQDLNAESNHKPYNSFTQNSFSGVLKNQTGAVVKEKIQLNSNINKPFTATSSMENKNAAWILSKEESNQLEIENPRQFVDNPEILAETLLQTLGKPKFKIKKTVECPSFSIRKKISAFLQPEFGLSLPQKMLQEKIPDVSEVTAYRKENEKSLEGIHASLLAGCFIGKSSFYVSTGLAYSRITEKLDLSYNYTRRDTTFGIISITKSQSGDTVTVIYGDIVTESTVEGQKIRHHYFHAYDIPIGVGYQMALSPKWNLNIEAGVLINFRLNTTGQVLRTLQDFTPVTKNEYQSSLGLGYKAALGIEYLLKPEIGLGVQARVQGYGKTFTSPNSNFQQKYIIPGAHLYLRYYFAL